jgi:ABC-type phosphate transport system substrate-binding protein
MNKKLIVSAAIAATGLFAGIVPVEAAPPGTGWDNVPDVAVGGGSDTTYLVSQRLEVLYNGAPGCTLSTSGATAGLCSSAAAVTPTNGNFDHDIMVGAFPTGSGAGVSGLVGVYNPSIDYARSSRGGSATELLDRTFWGFARDGIAVTTFGSRAGYSLTKQNLIDIFTCNAAANGGLGADDWSDFGFPAGPIVAWDMNNASGTRASFLTTYLGNGTAPVIPATCLRRLTTGVAPFENDVKPILADNGPDGIANNADDDENNFIWWQSFGNWQTYSFTTGAIPTGAAARVDANLVTVDGIAPSNSSIGNNTYPIGRTLFHVTREVDADCNTTVGTEGVCTPGPIVSGTTVGKGGAVRGFTEFICRTSNAQQQVNPVTGRGYRTEISLAIQAEGFSQIPTALRTTGYACQVFN